MNHKLYLPPSARGQVPFFAADSSLAATSTQPPLPPSTGPREQLNGGRKRSFDNQAAGGPYPYNGNDRAFKQPRRGGAMNRGGQYDNFGHHRGGFNPNVGPMHAQGGQGQQNGFPQMPGMPTPPPGMPPFDPNNPMAAIMAMQAMGFPVPGMPGMGNNNGNGSVGGGRGRCRDYDTKGYCARGNSCRYEHGAGSIYVPPGKNDGMSISALESFNYRLNLT
jgi:RNA-binding protein 26